MLSNIDNFLKMDIDVTPLPFDAMAKETGLDGEDIIIMIMSALYHNQIGRFGAVLNNKNAGFLCNSLVAWNIPEEKIDYVGNTLSKSKVVSHCYRRKPSEEWPYNLYTMVHARSDEDLRKYLSELQSTVEEIAPGSDFVEMKTLKELKKESFDPARTLNI